MWPRIEPTPTSWLGPCTSTTTATAAPIFHFDGPRRMGFECQKPWRRVDKHTYELNVGVGTKGLGAGTFTHLKYANNAIPDRVQPGAVLEFPNKTPGGPPVKL